MKLTILLLSLCFTLNSVAQVFKWVDENGRTHYGDQMSGNAKPHELKDNISSYKTVTFEASDILHDDRVVIYTKPTCGYCKKALSFFKKNKIKYKEYDVTKSNYAKRKYKRLNATGVPVTFIGNKRINGFNLSRFEREFAGL